MTHTDEVLTTINTQLKNLAGIYRQWLGDSISENTFWIWYGLLMMGENYTQSDLCSMWSLSKQTVHSIISQMEKNGYVTLEKIPGTRHKKRICLTERGRAYGDRLVMPMVQAEKTAIARLSQEEQQRFVQILTRYGELLSEEIDTLVKVEGTRMYREEHEE